MKNPLSSFKEKITQYVQLRFEEFRLEFIERISNVLGYLIYTIFLFFLFTIVIIFIGFGIAEWLSTLFDTRVGGFMLTAGLFVIILTVLILLGKRVIGFFINKIILLLTQTKEKKPHLQLDDDDNDE